jgi:hypothetical protein
MSPDFAEFFIKSKRITRSRDHRSLKKTNYYFLELGFIQQLFGFNLISVSDALFKFSILRRTLPTGSFYQREGFGHFRRLLSDSEKVSDTSDGLFLSARGFRTLPTAFCELHITFSI